MTDLRAIIEHDVAGVGPAGFGLEELSVRRQRKRRIQRIGTLAAALVIAAASVGLASQLFRSAERKQPAVPTPVTTRGIWAVDLDTGATSLVWGPRWLNEEIEGEIRGNAVGSPDITSDGRLVVTVQRAFRPFQIFALEADGSDLTQITDCEPPFHCPLGLGVHGPRWSPDGSAIAFVGGPNTRKNPSDIYVMDANGDDLRRVVQVAGEQDAVDWSPDGTDLVFDSESAEIYRVSVGGGPPIRLVRGGSDSLWSTDGRWIAFLSFGGDRSEGIWLIRPDGSGARFLAPGNLPIAWSPDGHEILVEQTSPDTLEERRGEVRTRRFAIVDVETGASRTLDIRAIEGAVFVFRWPAQT